MMLRIVTGVTAAILFAALIFYGPVWLMLVTALACAGLACLEFDVLFFPKATPLHKVRLAALVGVTVAAVHASATAGWIAAWLGTAVLYVTHVLGPSRSGDFNKAVHDVSLELLGFWYIVGLFGFLTPLAEAGPFGRHYLLLLSFIVFGGDSGAYFAGSRWGKHTLAVRVSPKKSVEGAVAAVVTAMGFSLLWLTVIVPHDLGSSYSIRILAVTPVISVLAQFGDLFESVLKRSQSRKDSGAFLPGHGGLLDRVDGLAIAAPVFYFYVVHILERI